MTKKILVTEQQLDRLVSFILEADVPIIEQGPEGDEKSDENSDEQKKLKILEEIRTEFNNSLDSARNCDDIYIWFGDVDEEENWVTETLTVVTLRVLSVGKDGISAKAIDVKGKLPFKEDKIYLINLTDCFNIEKEGAYLKFYVLDRDLVPDEKPEIKRNFTVSKFLSFDVESNENNCKAPIRNAKDISIKQAERYKAQVDKILKSIEYQPSLFGMNNIFFFPRGFAAMDDILSKYGLGVKKQAKEEKVVFNILEKPKKGSFEKNTYVEGIIDFKNNIKVGEWLFEVPKGQEIAQGQTFSVNVYKVTSKTKVFQFRTKIEVLEVQKIDSPDEIPAEKPAEKPENKKTETPDSDKGRTEPRQSSPQPTSGGRGAGAPNM